MAIISILLTAIIIIVSILIVLIVLVQRPKQEGLGAAFGGGAFDSALGAHTTDVLQKITTYFAVTFFVSAIGLAVVKSRQFSASPANNVLENVDNLDTTTPGMPAGISNLPGLDTEEVTLPAPVIEDPAKPVDTPKEAPAPPATAETPSPEAAAPTPAPDAPAPEAAAPPKTPAPEAPAETPAPAKEAGKGGK